MNVTRCPTIGQVVLYRLSAMDVSSYRPANIPNAKVGNILPMIVTGVKIRFLDSGAQRFDLNGHVLLDGPGTFWVAEVGQGDDPGEWHRKDE